MRRGVKIELVPGVASRHRYESASRYSISFSAGDPKIAANVANDLASFFTESSIERREQQARLTTEFLRRQLQGAERDLREQERMIREFKEKYRGELPDELKSVFRKEPPPREVVVDHFPHLEQTAKLVNRWKEGGRLFSYLRTKESEKLIIVVNFDAGDSFGFDLQLPEYMIRTWALEDGAYPLKDVLSERILELSVTHGVARVRIDLEPLESLILNFI